MLTIALLAIGMTAPAHTQDTVQNDHPVRHDRTGIHWQTPFEAAQAEALKTGRLLAIKPVAFGTTKNGCW